MSCRQPTAVSEFLENNKPHCTQPQVTQTTEEGYFGMEDGGVSADWPKLGRGWQSSGLEAFAIGYSTGTGPLTHWG